MSKYVCLSCQKQFKVSVRAPMTCPTKHLCNVVLNEREASGSATSTTTSPNDQQRISDTLRLPIARAPVDSATQSPQPPLESFLPAAAPSEESGFALQEFVIKAPPAQPATAALATPSSNKPSEAVGALIIKDQRFPILHGHVLGREGDLGRELFRTDKTVGRLHARLDITPTQELAIRNLAHSGNPVIVDGAPLAFNATAVLRAGLHKIQLGTRFLCSINVFNAGKHNE